MHSVIHPMMMYHGVVMTNGLDAYGMKHVAMTSVVHHQCPEAVIIICSTWCNFGLSDGRCGAHHENNSLVYCVTFYSPAAIWKCLCVQLAIQCHDIFFERRPSALGQEEPQPDLDIRVLLTIWHGGTFCMMHAMIATPSPCCLYSKCLL